MRRGFTLVETLVAVTILAIAIAGPMYAASRALVAAQNSNHQLTASLLTQEALERVRQLRDNAYLAADGRDPSGAWSTFTGTTLGGCKSSLCTVDALDDANPIAACSSCAVLKINGNKQYTQLVAGGTATPYTRTIRVRDVMSGGVVVGQEITATTSWSFRGSPYSVVVKDILMPWQPQL